MLKKPGRVIGALLVGNNIALVLYGILMAKALEPWLHSLWISERSSYLVAQTDHQHA